MCTATPFSSTVYVVLHGRKANSVIAISWHFVIGITVYHQYTWPSGVTKVVLYSLTACLQTSCITRTHLHHPTHRKNGTKHLWRVTTNDLGHHRTIAKPTSHNSICIDANCIRHCLDNGIGKLYIIRVLISEPTTLPSVPAHPQVATASTCTDNNKPILLCVWNEARGVEKAITVVIDAMKQ